MALTLHLSVPVDHVRVDGNDDANNQVDHSQRDDHQAESLAKSPVKIRFKQKCNPTCLRHFLDVRISVMSKIFARIIKPAMTFFKEFLHSQ